MKNFNSTFLNLTVFGALTVLSSNAFAINFDKDKIDLKPFVAASDAGAPKVESKASDPAEVDKALAAFQAQYKDIAGLFSPEEFRNPGEQKFLDKVTWNDPDVMVKVAAAKKQIDDNQKSSRNAYGLQAVLVGPNQLPRVYNIAKKAAAALELSDNFHLFIVASNQVNAFTYSYNVNDYDIILYSPIVDILDDEALLGVIGHEMGHVKDQVIVYKLAMAASFEAQHMSTNAAAHQGFYDTMFEEMPAGLRNRMANSALQMVADRNVIAGATLTDAESSEFGRDAELTADRAGVIAGGGPMGILKTMAALTYGSKELLTEMNLKALVEQVRSVLANTNDTSDISTLVGVEGNHPFNVLRLVEAADFGQTKNYEAIRARLNENSFGKEIDIFTRIVISYAEKTGALKDYNEKRADTDETLIRLKTRDGYTKQISRLGKGFGALGVQILGQLGASALGTPGDSIFDEFVMKVKNDETRALKLLLAPAVTDYLKKQADLAKGDEAAELKAKLKALADATELK